MRARNGIESAAGRRRRPLTVAAVGLCALVIAVFPTASSAKGHKHQKGNRCSSGCIYQGMTSQEQTIQVTLKTRTLGANVGPGMVVQCDRGTPNTILVEPQFGFSGKPHGNSFSAFTSNVGGHGPVSRTLTGTRTGGIRGTLTGEVSVSHSTDMACMAVGTVTYTASFTGFK